MKLIIVSGRSGSGKTVALRVLEDLGYYCVDNIPVNLLPALTHTVINDYENVAVSLDVRNLPKDPQDIPEIIAYLPKAVDVNTLFLDAQDNDLIRRFSETRRLHPLIRENMALDQAIALEKSLLEPISTTADLYIKPTQIQKVFKICLRTRPHKETIQISSRREVDSWAATADTRGTRKPQDTCLRRPDCSGIMLIFL